MANQSILLAIRRMWEYFTVPPPGDLGFASEERDPVGEFLEQQSRGGGMIEAETEAEIEAEEVLPVSNYEPEDESSQAAADMSPSPVDNLEAEPTTSPNESESEVLPPAADMSQNETEGEVILEMTDSKADQAENEEEAKLDDVAPDETGEKVAEEATKEGNQEGGDDLLDIFRSEKEVKQSDTLHDSLADIDIQELLEEGRDLLADINARRYRRT
ncbi:MAG TPA: hypothetical protein G4O10_01185 [Dehalococcoidia bacterium]|nr:hypothetical protein [Dehalococcoidia bacterium]